MIDIVKIFTIYLILLYTCYLFGVTVFKIVKFSGSAGKAVIVGFFALFGMFQFLALPFILLKQSLSNLTMAWGIVLTVLLLVFSRWSRREFWKTLKKQEKGSGGNMLLCAVILILILLEIVMQINHNYWGWDTAYYIGTVNTSLHTDTMYLYDGTTGLLLHKMNLRYAFSSFYMLVAVSCKTFSLHPILAFRYISGIACILLANVIAYEMGRELFPKEMLKQKAFVIVYIILNFLWVSDYSNAEFLLKRGYESKGYCANVIVPTVVLLGLMILRRKKQERGRIWWLMFVVCLASVPVSMSALALVPIMLFTIVATCFLLELDWCSVGMGILCVLPNMAYAVVYFLYIRGMLVIGV